MNRKTLNKIAECLYREKGKPNKLSKLELKRIERSVLNNPEFFKESIIKYLKNINTDNIDKK